MKNTQNRNGRDKLILARAQKWAAVLKEFHRSGQTRNAFARQQGIALSTLNYWLTRESDKRKALKVVSSPGIVFSELKLAGQDLAANSTWAMEIVTREGLTVRIREALPVGVLIDLLQGRGC